MTKHSKNNTAKGYFTYYEKKKIKDAGTQRERLGVDSMRSFEHCWLCLRPAVKPVCTPLGFVYCKDCIVLNLAKQKKDTKECQLLYSQQLLKKEREMKEKEMEKTAREIEQFLDAEGRIKSTRRNHTEEENKQIMTENAASNKSKFIELDKAASVAKDFWIPQTTPSASQPVMPEPKSYCVCPITNTRLRLKELIELKPETVTSDTENTKWLCAVSKKPITHQKAGVIKPTGQVILMDCIDKYVLGKQGFCSDRNITKRDIIPLIPGGTGFARHNKVQAETFRPVLE